KKPAQASGGAGRGARATEIDAICFRGILSYRTAWPFGGTKVRGRAFGPPPRNVSLELEPQLQLQGPHRLCSRRGAEARGDRSETRGVDRAIRVELRIPNGLIRRTHQLQRGDTSVVDDGVQQIEGVQPHLSRPAAAQREAARNGEVERVV